MSRILDSFLTWGLEEQTPEQGKELPTTLKSEEELAKFTVDEHLNEVERTILFLNGGQVVQQRHAIASLPGVIKGRGRQAWESISVPLKAALNRLDTDCQIEAAEVFAHIARERLMSPMDLQAGLLPTIMRNINKEKSEDETDAWIRALFELVPMLDKEVLKSEVLSMALSKGDMEENIGSRVICARILGAISTYLTKDEVERGFFKKAMSMCQDVEYQVRLAMCQQLGSIGRTVGKDVVLKSVLDELFELLKDEENQVRAAAYTSLIALLDLLPPDVRKSRVLPILRDHMQPFDMDVTMQRCIARNFGQMLIVVKGEFEVDDPPLFYGCFKHLTSKGDPELRRNCAAQFGQVLKAASMAQPGAFSLHFVETLHSMTADVDEEVRVSIATQFHEVARFAGRDSVCMHLTRPLARILRDDNPKVQGAVLPMLNTTLQCFVSDDGPRRQAAIDDIVRALIDLEARSNRNWRLQAGLASAFPSFHQTFSSDVIYDHFLPMAYRFLSNSAAAVRPVAAEGITCFLRYNRKDKQRADIFLRLIREYARGKSFTQRLAFAEVCRNVVRRFSSKFIKEWVFDLCLELLYDPVPNVRLQITHILPVLKQTIRLPEDVDLLERLNNAISNSMTDNDRDVSVTARAINDTYKRTPVRMGGGVSMMDPSGGAQAAYEQEDKRKEAEEADFSFAPEDTKEIKAEIVQMNYKKRAAPGPADIKAGGSGRQNAAAGKPGGSVNINRTPSGAAPGAASLGVGGAAAKSNLGQSTSARPGAASSTVGSGAAARPGLGTTAGASAASGAGGAAGRGKVETGQRVSPSPGPASAAAVAAAKAAGAATGARPAAAVTSSLGTAKPPAGAAATVSTRAAAPPAAAVGRPPVVAASKAPATAMAAKPAVAASASLLKKK